MDAIETVRPTGSSDATIIVSVRAVLRPTPESIPISSTLTRGIPGVGEGDGEASADADGVGEDSMPKSGSSDSTGGGVSAGTHAPPESTGSKTAAAALLASSVRPASQICGPTTIATATSPAASVVNGGRKVVMARTAPRAMSRQPSTTTWSASSTPRTAGSNRRVANEVALPVAMAITATPPITTMRATSGKPSAAAQRDRPATWWPRPGKIALSSSRRGAVARPGRRPGRAWVGRRTGVGSGIARKDAGPSRIVQRGVAGPGSVKAPVRAQASARLEGPAVATSAWCVRAGSLFPQSAHCARIAS